MFFYGAPSPEANSREVKSREDSWAQFLVLRERSGSTKTPCRKMSSLPLWWMTLKVFVELMLDYLSIIKVYRFDSKRTHQGYLPSNDGLCWIWFGKFDGNLSSILGKMTCHLFPSQQIEGNQYIDGQVTSWRQNRMIDFPSSKQTSIAMDSIVLNIGSTVYPPKINMSRTILKGHYIFQPSMLRG